MVRLRALAIVAASALVASIAAPHDVAARPAVATVSVRVTPPYGAWPSGLRATFSLRESRIVAGLQGTVDALADADVPRSSRFIRWHVEPSAEGSQLLELARRSLVATQTLFERAGILEVQPTDIVVGRTQDFLAATVRSLGCLPELSRTGGQFLMGASLCGNTVITMDLSGLLFVVRSGQRVTPAMEHDAEPPIASIPYQLVDRSTTVLSHEWAHAVRFVVAGATQPRGEPSWFREGFPEWVALASRARAFAPDMTYEDAHAMRVHLFGDWPSHCTTNPADYRNRPTDSAGCEYYVGVLAIELLVARYGGFAKLVDVYRRSSSGLRFAAAFRAVYGMSLAEFEASARGYVSGVAAAMQS